MSLSPYILLVFIDFYSFLWYHILKLPRDRIKFDFILTNLMEAKMLTLPRNVRCGYFDSREFGNLVETPPRIVKTYEIEFYLEDAKAVFTDENIYKIKKDNILIARPGQTRHSLLPFKTLYLKFEASGEIAEKLDSSAGYFLCSHPQTIRKMLEEIALLKESGDTIMLYSKLLACLNLICSDARIPVSQGAKAHKVISDAKKYIEQNSHKPITLEDISTVVHLSPIHFHNTFSKATGMSPHKYLISCRIEAAKKLLWDTEIPLSAVAEKTGFGCQQYLSKVFKKETGVSPATYRKTCQGNYLI